MTPTPVPGADLIAFETGRDGNSEIYLLDSRTGELTNLTRHPANDRSPAWRPDGGAIAFESHRDGNWEIYLLDLSEGYLTRLTDNLAYDGAPAWSPDGAEIAFESYRDGNLEIYAMAATGGGPRRLTADPAGDYGPAWSPSGDTIAFTSWRDGDKEIHLVPAEGGEARNLTQNPSDDEDPAWASGGDVLAFTSWRDVDAVTGNRNAEIYKISVDDGQTERLTTNPWPDLDPAWDAEGRLLWTAYEPGPPFETYDPFRPGDYQLYRLGRDGPERLTDSGWDDRRPVPAPARIVALESLPAQLPPEPATPAPQPTLDAGVLAEVVQVPDILASFSQEPIKVNELVAPSLTALQEDILEASGWDLLQMTLGAWRSIEQVRKRDMYAYDYGYLSWHKAGRALDFPLEYKVDGVDQMLLSREDLGDNVYWRMYLRTATQDGTQGEPLKENPWLYWWHIVPDSEPEAYDAGGKRLPVPAGYFADVTAIAKRHGWERIAAYAIEDDYHWHVDSNGTEYWHYERTDGLNWWEAMGQLYPTETLETHVGWEAGLGKAQTEEMMQSKGVPAP
jgi:TolB protein